jgi:two-component system, OmpR family, response regulator ChvI
MNRRVVGFSAMKQRQAYMILQPNSTSWISLPTFKSFFSKAQIASLGPNANAVEQKRKIMVVDDEEDLTLMFRLGLERKGFAVDVFNDSLEALSRFKPDYYDLILLDVKMPRMTGFELFREIRKHDSRAKVCFISAFEIHENELKSVMPDQDGKCIVRKPVAIKELIKIINEEIAGRQTG